MVILSEVGDVGKGGGASPTLGGACWQRGALGGAGAISGAGDGECEDERPGGDFAGVWRSFCAKFGGLSKLRYSLSSVFAILKLDK